MASTVAFLIAVDVTVAPVTASTSMLFASKMLAGSWSTASVPIFGVSFCSVTLME